MKYAAVIVTYSPSFDDITDLVSNLISCGIVVVVFDNTPIPALATELRYHLDSHFGESVNILNANGNKGLSIAFNESVTFLREIHDDLDGIFIFDQDSKITSDLLLQLITSYQHLKNIGVDVGVIGGMPIDPDNKPYHYRTSKPQLKTYTSKLDVENIIPVEFVISSFSLVPISTFDKIGLFEKDYFIDLIDNEFCFRCIQNGLGVFMIRNAKFNHVVGSARISIFGRLIAVSSPFRNYYQFRNPILVAKKYGWYFWCFKMLSQRFVQVTLSGMKERNLLKRYKFVFKGIVDGIKSRGGELR